MTLLQDIRRFQARTNRKMRQAVRATVKEIATNVASRTPIGTYEFVAEGWQDESYQPGALVANWRITVGSPSFDEVGSIGSTKGPAVDRLSAEAALVNIGDVVYIQNNSRYCEVLEFGLFPWRPSTKRTIQGFSKQAPTGMARVGFVDAVSRLTPILEAIGRT